MWLTRRIHPKEHAPFDAQVRVAKGVLDGTEGGFPMCVEFQALDEQTQAVLERVFG